MNLNSGNRDVDKNEPGRNYLGISFNTRSLILSTLLIWGVAAVVIGIMYVLVVDKIWSDLEGELKQEAEQFQRLRAENSDLDLVNIVAKMQPAPELYVIHPPHAGHELLGDLKQQKAAMHQWMSLAKPPQHIEEHLHILVSSEGAKLITNNVLLADGSVVQFSKRVDYVGTLEKQLLSVAIWGVLVTLTFALLASLLISRLHRRRLAQLDNALEDIVGGQLARRIDVAGQRDEYIQVAKKINAMLDRIQQLMTTTRQTSDNIAHELRQPLSRLRARLENLQNNETAQEVDHCLSDLDRVLDMSDQLLKLAQIESGVIASGQHIQVDQVLVDLEEFYQPLAQDQGIQFSLTTQACVIPGDANLLFQALSNVLDNAFKYTPKCGQVSVANELVDGECLIKIKDNGPGVPEAQIEEIFERFHRADASRSQPGFGLGLSLVKAIVHMHQGSLSVHNRPEGGLEFRLRFLL